MSKIKLVLVPPFMVKHVNSGAIKKSDLLDWSKLRAILSDLSVAKYYRLNTQLVCESADSRAIMGLLCLNNLKEYVDNPLTDVPKEVDSAALGYTGVLDYLCEVGNEPMNEVLKTQISKYALRFDVLHISNKTYGIMFKPLCEVDSPCSRLEMFRQDLDELLKQVSLEMSDQELLQEDLFQEYLSLM